LIELVPSTDSIDENHEDEIEFCIKAVARVQGSCPKPFRIAYDLTWKHLRNSAAIRGANLVDAFCEAFVPLARENNHAEDLAPVRQFLMDTELITVVRCRAADTLGELGDIASMEALTGLAENFENVDISLAEAAVRNLAILSAHHDFHLHREAPWDNAHRVFRSAARRFLSEDRQYRATYTDLTCEAVKGLGYAAVPDEDLPIILSLMTHRELQFTAISTYQRMMADSKSQSELDTLVRAFLE
jgi:hypothetical protein